MSRLLSPRLYVTKPFFEPGPGACFLDYDNDGKIDIFLADNGAQGGMSLYHNLGNGKFEDVTEKAGFDPNVHGDRVAPQATTTTTGSPILAVSFGEGMLLLHNEKNGTFKDVAAALRVSRRLGVDGLTFIDYDHDGDLDLYRRQSE